MQEQEFNSAIRGTYLIDNQETFHSRMPRKENIKFIANYVFANPGCGANECRRALLRWRGFKECDKSRGQYASYFYDFYHYKWYHHKLYSVVKGHDNKKRMVITTQAMSLIDRGFQDKLKKWDKKPRVRIVLPRGLQSGDQDITGLNYYSLFPKKS